MLAGNADNFLRIGGAGIGARANAQENILELVHAGIGEQKGLIPMRDHRRAGDDLVPARPGKSRGKIGVFLWKSSDWANKNQGGMFIIV